MRLSMLHERLSCSEIRFGKGVGNVVRVGAPVSVRGMYNRSRFPRIVRRSRSEQRVLITRGLADIDKQVQLLPTKEFRSGRSPESTRHGSWTVSGQVVR